MRGTTPAKPGAPAASSAARRAKGGGEVAGRAAIEILFEALFATELGLMLFGGVAIAVGVPLLVVFGGAAWAAHLRRKHDPNTPEVGLGALLTPAVLFVIFLVVALFGTVGITAFLTGHPAMMWAIYGAALATLGFVGFEAWRRRSDRLGRTPPPPSVKLKNR